MKTDNIEDWTFEEILEGVGETFNGMLVQKYVKNEPLYPIMRNALRWLVVNYIKNAEEGEKREEDEIEADRV